MPSTSEDPPQPDDRPEDHDDETTLAEDGMSPMIANTGADDSPGDDADAPSG